MHQPGFDSKLGEALLMRMIMMQTPPAMRAGIRALDADRISVGAGFTNKMTAVFMRATPRRIHQAVLSRIMAAGGETS